jgi:hypothetical protein
VIVAVTGRIANDKFVFVPADSLAIAKHSVHRERLRQRAAEKLAPGLLQMGHHVFEGPELGVMFPYQIRRAAQVVVVVVGGGESFDFLEPALG